MPLPSKNDMQELRRLVLAVDEALDLATRKIEFLRAELVDVQVVLDAIATPPVLLNADYDHYALARHVAAKAAEHISEVIAPNGMMQTLAGANAMRRCGNCAFMRMDSESGMICGLRSDKYTLRTVKEDSLCLCWIKT